MCQAFFFNFADSILYHIGPHEVQVFEADSNVAEESNYAMENSAKNPGHKDFLPARDFMINHLPRSLGDEGRRCLEAALDLTVRIRVDHTSVERPDGDVLSAFRGTNKLRVGTGFICLVDDPQTNKPCPCDECKGEIVTKYWVLSVRTAHHVVHNTDEAKHANVDLFFDDDESQFNGKMTTLQALEMVWSRNNHDGCGIECVTHDQALGERIKSLHRRWYSLLDFYEDSICSPKKLGLTENFEVFVNRVMSFRPEDMFTNGSHGYAVCISHPHGQPKKITVGRVVRVVKKTDGGFFAEYHTPTCPGTSGAPVFPLFADHKDPRAALRYALWGFIHGGNNRSSSPLVDQVNYGNY